MNKFGERIKLLRKQRNISQISLSTKIGICQEAISSYERGATTPSIDVLYKMHRFFRVSTDYLLGISDKENTVSYNELNDSEASLIQRYRELSHSDKETLLKIAGVFTDKNTEEDIQG